jgi:hypothetical protein
MTRWTKFRKLSRGERRLLVRSWWLVGSVRVGLWLLPYARLRRILDRRSETPVDSWEARPDPERIAWAVTVASEYFPRAETCLTRALAALYWLRRFGHPAELKLGVALDERKEFSAHAWVLSEGRVVIGDDGHGKFTPLESGSSGGPPPAG